MNRRWEKEKCELDLEGGRVQEVEEEGRGHEVGEGGRGNEVGEEQVG